MEWRRSYDARPPLMTDDHPHFLTINADPRYRHLTQQPIATANDDIDKDTSSLPSSSLSGVLPRGESLADCQLRVVEAWKDVLDDVRTEFDEGNDFHYSLLVAHANTLRALVMHLDDIPVDDIEGLNIPTAIPFYYDINKSTGEVVMSSAPSTSIENVLPPGTFRGTFITDERKKQSFLERRRAANDPWMWALHSDQVAPSMLNATAVIDTNKDNDLIEEARKNTNLFAPGQTDPTTGEV
jgi:Histidine phosphatase superfamily (branch 1)